MARPVVVILAGLLAGSVAANLYQWRHRPSGASAAADAPAPRQAATNAPAPATPPTTTKRPDGAPPPIAATCERQLVDLGQRLAAAQATIEERLSWNEKFERSLPAPEAEARLSPLVAKVFEKAPDGYSFEVECRGEVCNVLVTEPDQGDYEWWDALQKDVYWKEGQGHSTEGARPTHDPVTKAALRVTKTQLLLNGSDTTDGMPLLQSITDALHASGAAQRCSADGTRGYLSLQLWLSGEPRTIDYEVGGTLASSPGGRCVLATLDQIIASTTIPPRSRTAALYHTIELPPP